MAITASVPLKIHGVPAILLVSAHLIAVSCGGAAGGPGVEPQRVISGARGCQPIDITADQAGQVYLAVTCQSPPAQAGSGTAAGAPAGAPIVLPVQQGSRIAAGAPGVVYRLEEIHADAARSTDGGKTWTGLARPNGADHWVEVQVVAAEDRVLMAAANIGRLGLTAPPWPLDIWRFPVANGQAEVSSSGLMTGGPIAVALQPGSTTAWIATVIANQILIARSDDDGRTLGPAMPVMLPAREGTLRFGGSTLFSIDPEAAANVIAVVPDGTTRTVSLPADVAGAYRGAVADAGGALTVFFARNDQLSVVRLDGNAETFSAPARIGPVADWLVACAPTPGNVAYAGTAGGEVVFGAFTW